MKIVESAQQRNPELITEQLNAFVDQFNSYAKTTAQDGKSFDFVERTVLTSVLEIGRKALDLLLALQGDGDLDVDQAYDPAMKNLGQFLGRYSLR